MGRGKKHRKRQGDNKEGPPTKRGRPDTWQQFHTSNEKFSTYYKGLGFMTEAEFEELNKVLQTELPVTFRINESSPFREQVSKRLLEFQRSMTGISYVSLAEADPVPVNPPAPIPWFPGSAMGWYFQVPKRFLKKTPGVEEFNKYLILQSDVGTITRQEAVSMLPPLFMNVEPHHHVLDLCAAPGSKTVQLLEALHKGCTGVPSGVVIANDADRARCDMLSHQLQRLNSPCVAVTHHNAQQFPSLKGANGKNILFDRILCDVPCSGDGTLRKNPDIWGKWNPFMGVGQHNLQLTIASRAFDLLKPGCRMVYSTCSMNPVENEAVVASLIQKYKGRLQIADVSQSLPLLKRKNGLKTWKLMDREGNWFSSHEEVPEDQKLRYPKTCFPPSLEILEEIHIERCLRLMPYDQDTGGFFVAVLDKLALPEEQVVETDAIENPVPKQDTDIVMKEATATEQVIETPEVKEDQKPKPQNKNKKQKSIEDLLPLSDATLQLFESVRKFYGLSNDFSFANLLARTSEAKPQKILLLSQTMREIILNNPRLKVVNSGIRIFQAVVGEETDYRVVQTGVDAIGGQISKRIVEFDIDDLMNLLVYEDPMFHSFSTKAQDLLQAQEIGSLIFMVKFGEQKMHFVGWRGKVSCKVLLKKTERNLLVQYFQSAGILPPPENATTTVAL